MLRKKITIINKLGLHARAAAKMVNLANRFASESKIIKENKTVNAKSIMGLMMLAASQGSEIELEIEGEDEKEAMDALSNLINNRFEEDA